MSVRVARCATFSLGFLLLVGLLSAAFILRQPQTVQGQTPTADPTSLQCAGDGRISASHYEPPIGNGGTRSTPEEAKDAPGPFPPKQRMQKVAQDSSAARFDYHEGGALKGIVMVRRAEAGGWYVGSELWCYEVVARQPVPER